MNEIKRSEYKVLSNDLVWIIMKNYCLFAYGHFTRFETYIDSDYKTPNDAKFIFQLINSHLDKNI